MVRMRGGLVWAVRCSRAEVAQQCEGHVRPSATWPLRSYLPIGTSQANLTEPFTQ